ncbi:MAG: Phosphoribosyltransferase [Promethearchaeota archaeon]|jgi:predicted phosphoribosyltransferase|nr:MAG: Phosphoribosyltransferase [Candidatus Lokiarchaeota archaeon]
MKYENRSNAGEKLADAIKEQFPELISDSIICAIPRGGVPVAYIVAEKLTIPFNLVITKKLSHPNNPEVAIGAIAPDGTYDLNERVQFYGVTDDVLNEIKNKALEKVKKRINKYTQEGLPNVQGKNIFVIDDGIATGFTALVAGKYLKNQGTKKVILAIPVAPKKGISKVKEVFDDVVCPTISESYSFAVGAYYEDFHQNTDEELYDYIEKAKKNNLFYTNEY